jgi:exodeoxyribonuclease-5
MEPLSAEQERALDSAGRFMASDEKLWYMAGPAGTGKTTLAKRIAANVDGLVLFAAYTGKAASVLARKGCHGATTIHRLYFRSRPKSEARLVDLKLQLKAAKEDLAANVGDRERERKVIVLERAVKEEEKVVGRPAFDLAVDEYSDVSRASLVIIDEVSMVDEKMATAILSATKKVIVTGDPFQLPPVGGAGYFLRRKPDVMLREIHRQARESAILRLATDIREGRGWRLGEYGPDCRVIRRNDERCRDLCLAADQQIVGRNATRRAANDTHRRLRGRTGKLPEAGDRVICLRNNHEIGIQNGTLWTVLSADPPTDHGDRMGIVVESADDPDKRTLPLEVWTDIFEGANRPPFANPDDPECFDHGYAITCHKSQGSEWPKVYINNESHAFRESRREWEYTAVTRASEDLTLVIP